jgi:hypothetical protein
MHFKNITNFLFASCIKIVLLTCQVFSQDSEPILNVTKVMEYGINSLKWEPMELFRSVHLTEVVFTLEDLTVGNFKSSLITLLTQKISLSLKIFHNKCSQTLVSPMLLSISMICVKPKIIAIELFSRLSDKVN